MNSTDDGCTAILLSHQISTFSLLNHPPTMISWMCFFIFVCSFLWLFGSLLLLAIVEWVEDIWEMKVCHLFFPGTYISFASGISIHPSATWWLINKSLYTCTLSMCFPWLDEALIWSALHIFWVFLWCRSSFKTHKSMFLSTFDC